MHRRRDGGSDETIEPVIVGLLWPGFPFVDSATAAFRADVVFGGNLLGKHSVFIGTVAEDGEATSIAHGDGESCMGEGLPPVRIVDHVADRPFAMNGWDSPVESDSITGPAFVFAEGIRRGADEPSV